MRKIVDIIVVNWNSAKKAAIAVRPYLQYQSDIICCNVIVVDNGSSDGSVELLRNLGVRLIMNEKNLGFAKACNQAFRDSKADYILLLNPDTQSEVLVLERLVLFLENNRDYGSIGPQLIDENGNVLRTCGRFPDFRKSLYELFGLSKVMPKLFTPVPIMKDWDHGESRNVDQIMGCYSLIRKSLLDEIGFMDERFFVYFEDLDLNKRINDVGYKTYFSVENSVYHEGGGSGGPIESQRLFYSLNSRASYWKKHFKKGYYFFLVCLSLTVEPPLRLIDSFIKEKKIKVKKIHEAYYLYFKNLITGER